MSIQLRVYFFKDDEQVRQGTVCGGYAHVDRSDEQLILDVLDNWEYEKKWLAQRNHPPLPEWNKFWIQVGKRIIEHTI